MSMRVPHLELLPIFLRELLTKEQITREPEPSLVMDQFEEVQAFVQGGRANAFGATYFLVTSHVTQVLYGCSKVVDLCCGPATVLCQIAAANPSIQFTGVDLSTTMLAEAKKNIQNYGVKNVTLLQADVTKLDVFANQSFDGVISTFSLHHLPTYQHLEACFKEMQRILKPGGAVYLIDFTRLKTLKSIVHLAHMQSHGDPEVFTRDKELSMRAAFTFGELKQLAQEYFAKNIQVFSTFKVPLFTIIRTPPREIPHSLMESFKESRLNLEPEYRQIMEDLRFFFYLDGLRDDVFGPLAPGAWQQAKVRMMEFATLPTLQGFHSSYVMRMAGVLSMSVKLLWFYAGYRVVSLFDRKNQTSHQDYFFEKAGKIVQHDLGALKGPLMKFAQVISYLPQDLPPAIRQHLSTLQSHSAPYKAQFIRTIVERELGQPAYKIFKEWYDTPIAAASISQIHLARLYNDQLVAVKVRYPRILSAIKTDLQILRLFYPVLKNFWGFENIRELVDELETLILSECDFRKAAEYQEEFRLMFAHDPDIIVPRVYTDYSTSEVLTMDYIEGQTYEEFKTSSTQEQKNHAAEIIWRVASISLNQYGIYNADPHPGNYLFVNHKVAFIDFGFTRRFPVKFMDLWKEQSMAGCTGNYQRFEEINRELGYDAPGKTYDHKVMYEAYRNLIYQAWRYDRIFRFTKAFVQDELKALLKMFKTSDGKLRMPVEFVAIVRLFWGHHALFADLQAESNWHQIVYPLLEKRSDPDLFDPIKRRSKI